ncbi:abasic site processing protein HMCES-like isoform X2 [Ornithodoros turicata]
MRSRVCLWRVFKSALSFRPSDQSLCCTNAISVMCGRTACNLSPGALQSACCYRGPSGSTITPQWADVNKTASYRASYNIAPKAYNPVLLNGCHLKGSACSGRVLAPLHWGLVPSWFKGDPRTFRANTINCRLEECSEKCTYRTAIEKNQRCVVLAEGFFEWATESTGTRQPYFVYFEQPEWISMSDRFWDSPEDPEKLMKDEKWLGPRLLTMAGLYDISALQDDFLSYTVLTMAAPKRMEWLHSRVPVILDGDDAVSQWLDPSLSFKNVTASLVFPENILWHPVSKEVGNVMNNTVDCVLPLKKKLTARKPTMMDTWLKRSVLSTAKKSGQIVQEVPSHTLTKCTGSISTALQKPVSAQTQHSGSDGSSDARAAKAPKLEPSNVPTN